MILTAKNDILTEYLTLFWFALLVNEYKLYVSIQKSSKDAQFGQCLYLEVPLCYEYRTDAQNGLYTNVQKINTYTYSYSVLIMLIIIA